MKRKKSSRTWFITGSSTGFGRLLAEEVLKSGDNVVATARKVDQVSDLEKKYPGHALALSLDVTKQDQVDAAVAKTLERFGRVDVLVNNAGYGVAGAIEEVSLGPLGRACDQRHVVAVAMVQSLDGQDRILLRPADDQPGDDVDDPQRARSLNLGTYRGPIGAGRGFAHR